MHFVLHTYYFFITALKDDIIFTFVFLSLLSMPSLSFYCVCQLLIT